MVPVHILIACSPWIEIAEMGSWHDQYNTLQIELEATSFGSVLWVTLNRPAAFNALSMELIVDLHAVIDSLQHPTTMEQPVPKDFPRVVVLRAAGRSFCGGVDVKVGSFIFLSASSFIAGR
jgi:enoyl-CoA hydratase/carnithine racemase